jgi:DNA invertase Pin-like site-specific DNA recombinase
MKRKTSRRWGYDPGLDRYALHPEQLANLELGRELKRREARKRRNTIRRLWRQGKSAADIVLLTGYSRAAVYRFLRETRDPILG